MPETIFSSGQFFDVYRGFRKSGEIFRGPTGFISIKGWIFFREIFRRQVKDFFYIFCQKNFRLGHYLSVSGEILNRVRLAFTRTAQYFLSRKILCPTERELS